MLLEPLVSGGALISNSIAGAVADLSAALSPDDAAFVCAEAASAVASHMHAVGDSSRLLDAATKLHTWLATHGGNVHIVRAAAHVYGLLRAHISVAKSGGKLDPACMCVSCSL